MGSIIGRNDGCPCGSGKKFKKCCLHSSSPDELARLVSVENLKRRVQGKNTPKWEMEPLFIQDVKGVRKMSEIILEFARPLLDEVESYDDHKKAILFAIIAWNLALDDEAVFDTKLEELCNELEPSSSGELATEFQQHMSTLIRRKRKHYSDVRRFVIDWEFVEVASGFHLNVVSTLLNDDMETKNVEAMLEKSLDPTQPVQP